MDHGHSVHYYCITTRSQHFIGNAPNVCGTILTCVYTFLEICFKILKSTYDLCPIITVSMHYIFYMPNI